MAYAAFLLTVLALFITVTPAHTAISHVIQQSVASVQHIDFSKNASSSLQGQLVHYRTAASEKIMELFREQLHRAIDSLVR